MKLYNAQRTDQLLAEAMREGADWSVLGPELAYQLQEARREINGWMLEVSHATQIADHWRRRYEAAQALLVRDKREGH